MAKVADVLTSEEFGSLPALTKSRGRKQLFILALKQNPELEAKFREADDEGKADIFSKVSQQMAKKFPDAWTTNGYKVSKMPDGEVEYVGGKTPVYDAKTEEFIEAARLSIQSGLESGTQTKARRDFFKNNLTEEQRHALAPFVRERYGKVDEEIWGEPMGVEQQTSLLRKAANIGIPTIARVLPPLAAAPTRKPGFIAAAAGLGEAQAQYIEKAMGTRQSLSPTELGIGSATAIIPLTKLKSLTRPILDKMTTATVRAAEGSVIGGGSEALRAVAEGEKVNAGNVALAAGFGGAVGTVMGGVEGSVRPKATVPDLKPQMVDNRAPRQGPRPKNDIGSTPIGEPYVKDPGGQIPETQGTGKPKERGFITSVKEATDIPQSVKDSVESFYNPKENAPIMEFANKYIDAPNMGEDAAKAIVMRQQSPTVESNAVALELIHRFNKNGREQDAIDIIEDLAPKATSQGEAIQILSRLSKATPEGILYYTQQTLNRYAKKRFGNKEVPQWFKDKVPTKITPAIRKKILQLQREANSATHPDVQLVKQAQIVKEIHSLIPNDIGSKIRGVANISMLMNPKTVMRNVLGNTIMFAGESVSDLVSVGADMAVSGITGQRTIAGPQVWPLRVPEKAKGLAQPFMDVAHGYSSARSQGKGMWKSAMEGIDTMAELARITAGGKFDYNDLTNGYRRTFDSRFGNMMEKTLTTTLAAPDRAFWSARLKSSLDTQMRAAGIDVPTRAMHERALLEAARSIYQDPNKFSRELNNIRKMMNRLSTGGRSEQVGVGQAVLPFTQVPGALAVRAAEFSPLGFIRMLHPLATTVFGKGGQREFAQQFGKAVTGTVGLATTGFFLERLGVITGAPEENKDVEALRRSLGLGAYRINVSELKRRYASMDWSSPRKSPLPGDTIYSYDWAQPLSISLALGAEASKVQRTGEKKGLFNNAVAIASGGIKALEEQPLLTGMARLFRDVGQGGYVGAAANAAMGLPGQFSPVLLSQAEQLRTNRVSEVRHSDKVKEAAQRIATRIPYLQDRLGFPQKTDVLGKAVERYQNGANGLFNVLLNPAFTSKVKNDPDGLEMLNLFRETGDTGSIPIAANRTVTVTRAGVQTKLELDSDQIADYQFLLGTTARSFYEGLLTSPAFLKMPPPERARRVGQIFTNVHAATKGYLFDHTPIPPNQAALAIEAGMRTDFRKGTGDLSIYRNSQSQSQ